MYAIGYDIGSSSIKAAIVDLDTGKQVAVIQQPQQEMVIHAPHNGWAEQDPEVWWEHVCTATRQLLSETSIDPKEIKGIGIAYQMHGLVMVDNEGQVIRPSIIWCDSRAVEVGDRAFESIGSEQCLSHLLNSPGNFTASKLRWVKENEPSLYERCHKIMLPGDYIAYRLSGEISTTISGLSEGIFWDFKSNDLATLVLDEYGIDRALIPTIRPTFAVQGEVSSTAANATGLAPGTPITYRAGDQPNNALSLNVLHPGEVAATGGTSGVVYGVVDEPQYDPWSRVNGFAHVNHQVDDPRIGILLCINGAGIQYGWVRNQLTPAGTTYPALEAMAKQVPVGADGLSIIPFGNGAERMLKNQDVGAHFINLQLNRHRKEHVYRAALEGIAHSFVYGMNILKEMGMVPQVIRVGNDNLFQSKIFSSTIANLTGAQIEVAKTTGAIGAAQASAVGAGIRASIEDSMSMLEVVDRIDPEHETDQNLEAYTIWHDHLLSILNR